MSNHHINIELRTTVRSTGEVELDLVELAMPVPDDNEIVVEMQGAPINPSDISLMLGIGDATTAERVDRDGRSITVVKAADAVVQAQRARWDVPMQNGNEGAGRVVATGASPEAKALLGRQVAIWGGGTYARYVKVRASDSIVLSDDVSPAEGAAAYINPLTALGMVETMRDEGFSALVHTAAASNLGQMLCRLCQAEGIGLVNIVRTAGQAEQLRSIGAEFVCDTSAPSFTDDLLAALRATGATLAFDATGGGTLAGQILTAMERAFKPTDGAYSLYGSRVFKKVYIYGALDPSPTQFQRAFGTAWAMGGWLLFPFLERVGPERVAGLKARVAGELKGIFASRYSHVISLAEACDPEVLRAVSRRATGDKYLIDASR